MSNNTGLTQGNYAILKIDTTMQDTTKVLRGEKARVVKKFVNAVSKSTRTPWGFLSRLLKVVWVEECTTKWAFQQQRLHASRVMSSLCFHPNLKSNFLLIYVIDSLVCAKRHSKFTLQSTAANILVGDNE